MESKAESITAEMEEPQIGVTDCPDLEALWDMGKSFPATRQIQLSHSDIGPYIHFVCPPGHHVIGPSMVTCLRGGLWDDVTEPFCSSSSLYGIPQSDSILIGVLAGSGAIVLITLTVILTHLFCIRSSTMRKTESDDNLHRSENNLSSTTYYVDDKSYCSISAPTCPTMNGKPLQTVERDRKSSRPEMSSIRHQSSRDGHHFDIDRNHLITQTEYIGKQEDGGAHVRDVSGRMTTIAGENVFVNYGFTPEQTSMYSNHWNQSSGDNSIQMTSLLPKSDGKTRTSSADTADAATSYSYYSTVNRTVL